MPMIPNKRDTGARGEEEIANFNKDPNSEEGEGRSFVTPQTSHRS